MSKNVLVVDDEPLMRDMLYSALRRKKMPVDKAEDGKEAVDMLSKKEYDIVITDIRMPRLSGMDLLAVINKKYPETDVIMLTAYGTIEDAVKAMQMGAYDFVEKKENTLLDEIEMRVDKLLEFRRMKYQNKELREEIESIKAERTYEKNFLGNNSQMTNLFDTIKLVADSSATVFIQGESGTGKELVARALHEQSPRRSKPFIKVNCAALPDGLIESELFGHEKGAFTGAIKTTQGKFELANGGTILLDEISEMNPLLQAKLLRVLQEREFEKIGDTKTVKLDVRIIATTNRDIHKAIEEGQFREDLFYRLNVISLTIPSLRDRKDDIPLISSYFVDKYSKIHSRKVESVSPDAMRQLINHNWPGNVRELENTIERAVVLSQGVEILPNVLFDAGKFGNLNQSNSNFEQPVENDILSSSGEVLPLYLMEQNTILRTLEKFEGSRTKTAEALEISIRTLRNKLNEYRAKGIQID
ncbi:MAG: sigma-54-dependent Fis family transcriptional regulator [Candidatus Delongbacteria bacterium]|nr:sigma-54-dependent Fis family transcriptional regulator [Candidatus Delongbacteria bacterium]MBN2834362.1 sigma-54-dependent Fis family transcriptional regulator [Candidatus Delongbacteria bacterium]